MYIRAIASVIVLSAGPAAAQDAGWTFRGSLYGWIPGLSATVATPFGDLESESTGSDALSALDMAFMGTLEARHGKLGVIGDLLYADLSTDEDSPFGLRFDDATIETQVTALSGYAVYRVYETDRMMVDAGGGFRAFGVSLDIGLDSADSRPDYDASADETWIVPLVAARVILPFNESWFATAFADAGLTSDETNTWQVFGSVGYHFNERWSTQVGWRYMELEQEVGGQDVSIDLSGPLIGVSARF